MRYEAIECCDCLRSCGCGCGGDEKLLLVVMLLPASLPRTLIPLQHFQIAYGDSGQHFLSHHTICIVILAHTTWTTLLMLIPLHPVGAYQLNEKHKRIVRPCDNARLVRMYVLVSWKNV